jgi:hypothetical protein
MASRATRSLDVLGPHRVAQPILRHLTRGNGLIALLFCLLVGMALGIQFLACRLKCLLDFQPRRLRLLRGLMRRDPLVRQMGLEVLYRGLRLLQLPLRVLACGDLVLKRLPRLIELIRPATLIVLMMQDRDRHLTVADEPSMAAMNTIRCRRRRLMCRCRRRVPFESKGTAHLGLGRPQVLVRI